MPKLISPANKRTEKILISFSPAEIDRIDLMRGSDARASYIRAIVNQKFEKQFPNYSNKAQEKIASRADNIMQAEGAKPRKYITYQELIDLAGETSDYSDSFYFHIRTNHQPDGILCGMAPVELSQKGLMELLPKLIQYNLLEPGIDYILKESPITPTAPENRLSERIARERIARQSSRPDNTANARSLEEARRRVAEEDAQFSA